MNVRQLALVVAVAGTAVVGCSGNKDATASHETYSLTVFGYNAITREPIASADLAAGVALYEGATKVQPVVVDAALSGAVIFKDVPADYYAGNKYYAITANVSGFLPYRGAVSFAMNGAAAALRDDLLAQLGIIYLFPTGYQTPSYTFHVVNVEGKPVKDATVSLSPGNFVTGTDATNSVISAFDGLVKPLIQKSDADGKVTFASADLALGVQYTLIVAPVVLDGVQLGSSAPRNVTIGVDGVDQVVALPDLVPGANATGLYVTSISTSIKDQVVASGTLAITFSRKVTLNLGSSGFGLAVLTPGGIQDATTAAEAAITGQQAGNPVTASLSSDGLTLTLTPNFVAPKTPVPAGRTADGKPSAPGDKLKYSDGTASVSVVGYSGVKYSVFALLTADNLPLAGNTDTVMVIAP